MQVLSFLQNTTFGSTKPSAASTPKCSRPNRLTSRPSLNLSINESKVNQKYLEMYSYQNLQLFLLCVIAITLVIILGLILAIYAGQNGMIRHQLETSPDGDSLRKEIDRIVTREIQKVLRESRDANQVFLENLTNSTSQLMFQQTTTNNKLSQENLNTVRKLQDLTREMTKSTVVPPRCDVVYGTN